MRIIVAALLLAGCVANAQVVPDRYFTTYQAMLSNQIWRAIEAGPYAAAPGNVKIAYADCSAAYVMSAMTPAEVARLDAYARHEITMTVGDLKEIERRASERLGGPITAENMGRLGAVCPDQVAAFRQYFRG